MIHLKNRVLGSFIGLAVGDAIGTTLEFKKRDLADKVEDMVGGGPFELNPGEWTDDTSMALCLADSLIDFNGFYPEDQMNKYYKWFSEGYNSSTGYCFDIGNTIKEALFNYKKTGMAYSGKENSESAGNGSLMRLAPIPIFYFTTLENKKGLQLLVKYAEQSSRTTHAEKNCLDACKIYALMTNKAFNGLPKRDILSFTDEEFDEFNVYSPKIREIVKGSYQQKNRSEISSSGYVVHSMEAALWAFYNTDSYKEGVLLAANLAGDSDTVAAIYGQLAGAYYGLEGIPQEWVEKLAKKEKLFSTALHLLRMQ